MKEGHYHHSSSSELANSTQYPKRFTGHAIPNGQNTSWATLSTSWATLNVTQGRYHSGLVLILKNKEMAWIDSFMSVKDMHGIIHWADFQDFEYICLNMLNNELLRILFLVAAKEKIRSIKDFSMSL